MDGNLIGARVERVEDRRFLTGAGAFGDDLRLPGQAVAAVVRSPYPHARIAGIDAEAARAAPGVLLVLTAAELASEGVGPIPSLSNLPPYDLGKLDGGPAADGSQPVLATGRARYLGEPVAFVVAETADQARDAAALVEVDYDPLPAVMTYDDAVRPDAPRIWDELASNRSFEWEGGDAAAVDRAFAEAAHVTRLDVVNNRIVAAFMEPRGAVAEVEAGSGRLVLHAGCQSAHGMRAGLSGMLGLKPEQLRVVVPDMGGGFGARAPVYPEFALLLVAARRLGRPVGWTADRGEAFLTDAQARDHLLRGELALDAEGNFTGLRLTADWRHGAYLTGRNIYVMIRFLPPSLGGAYRLPCAHTRIRGAFTNTTPLASFRGVGRVETNYLMESLVDAAARELGIDRLELRRRNLLTAADLPWTAAGGNRIVTGNFGSHLARALDLADCLGFAARREADAGRGLLRGFGIGIYVENDGGVPTEFAGVGVEGTAEDDGIVTVRVGTQDFGMGHSTMYAQVVADELGVPFDRIRVVFGDTDAVARGAGSHGSRSARIGGGAVVTGAREVVRRGRVLASELMEAAEADIEFRAGGFRVAGTDRSVTLFEVARVAAERGDPLAADADFTTPDETHPSGCHACEVTVDPDTGSVRLERYVVVADVGRIVNPLIVEGQMHGGAVQGIGQALLERIVYDPDSGQTLTGSFMDYTVPRADDVPFVTLAFDEVVEADNPLGVKGAGESATSGAPAAVMNAIRDALAPLGVTRLDMPATPERVWRAIREAAA
ncbi:xanthine dehydrogenase family protein molybdopterin-binding subunit [Thalassobaculum sp.]|uniref:xanthine dehydrogenase family protein molybdopterin-binding subunit n=1 Tax=Thalassobaculum sp. TaxID=2022740 RepID=UPI0032ED5D74